MAKTRSLFARRVHCFSCLVYFTIRLNPHPAWKRSDMLKHFPQFRNFLGKVHYCPVCKSPIEGLD